MSWGSTSCISVCVLVLESCFTCHWKEPVSVFFTPSIQLFGNLNEILPRVFSRLESPCFASLSSYGWCSSYLHGPLSDSVEPPCLSFVALNSSKINKYCSSGLTREEWRGRIVSIDLLAKIMQPSPAHPWCLLHGQVDSCSTCCLQLSATINCRGVAPPYW